MKNNLLRSAMVRFVAKFEPFPDTMPSQATPPQAKGPLGVPEPVDTTGGRHGLSGLRRSSAG